MHLYLLNLPIQRFTDKFKINVDSIKPIRYFKPDIVMILSFLCLDVVYKI